MRIFVILTVTVVLLGHHKSKGYSKVIEEFGIHSTEFQLACEQNNTNIVIFEARFFLDKYIFKACNNSCKRLYLPEKSFWKKGEAVFNLKSNSSKIIHFNLKHALNKRCSGVSYCNFTASKEVAEIGLGTVSLKYACVKDLHFTKSCNSSIAVVKEGFVKSPGYPKYYPGDIQCLWNLKASPPQRIKVTFLDISLRSLGPFEKTCLDEITVFEDGLNLFSTCGDVLKDIVVFSDGPSLNVSFKTSSKVIFPKRGFLFHYEAVGCPTLTKPADGYLVNRNETFAHYRCYVGFVFPDTKSRDKNLKCYENIWNGHLLDCVNITLEKEDSKKTITYNGNLTIEARFIMEMQDSLKDIIIPVIVICALFFGNAVILYFIYRNRKKMTLIDKMELKDLQPHT